MYMLPRMRTWKIIMLSAVIVLCFIIVSGHSADGGDPRFSSASWQYLHNKGNERNINWEKAGRSSNLPGIKFQREERELRKKIGRKAEARSDKPFDDGIRFILQTDDKGNGKGSDDSSDDNSDSDSGILKSKKKGQAAGGDDDNGNGETSNDANDSRLANCLGNNNNNDLIEGEDDPPAWLASFAKADLDGIVDVDPSIAIHDIEQVSAIVKDAWRNCIVVPPGRKSIKKLLVEVETKLQNKSRVRDMVTRQDLYKNLVFDFRDNNTQRIIRRNEYWLDKDSMIKLRGGAVLSHYPEFNIHIANLPKVSRGVRLSVPNATHGMQQTVVIALAHSLGCKMIQVDHKQIAWVRRKCYREFGVPKKFLSTEFLLSRLFEMLRKQEEDEEDEPFIVFLADQARVILESKRVCELVQSELEEEQSRLFFVLSSRFDPQSPLYSIQDDKFDQNREQSKLQQMQQQLQQQQNAPPGPPLSGVSQFLQAQGLFLPPGVGGGGVAFPFPNGMKQSPTPKMAQFHFVFPRPTQQGRFLPHPFLNLNMTGREFLMPTNSHMRKTFNDYLQKLKESDPAFFLGIMEKLKASELHKQQQIQQQQRMDLYPSSLSKEQQQEESEGSEVSDGSADSDEQSASKATEMENKMNRDKFSTGKGGVDNNQHLSMALSDTEMVSALSEVLAHIWRQFTMQTQSPNDGEIPFSPGFRVENGHLIRQPSPSGISKSNDQKNIVWPPRHMISSSNFNKAKKKTSKKPQQHDFSNEKAKGLSVKADQTKLEKASDRAPKVNEVKLFLSHFETLELSPTNDKTMRPKWNNLVAHEEGHICARHNYKMLTSYLEKNKLACPELQRNNPYLTKLSLTLPELGQSILVALEIELSKQVYPSVSVDESGNLLIPLQCLETALNIVCKTSIARPGEAAIHTKEALKKLVGEDRHEQSLISSVVTPMDIGVSYDMIGGLKEVKEVLRQCVTYPLRYPQLYSEGIAGEGVKGVLLFGPPGTGKTMLAKAVATEGGASFIAVDSSVIESKWLGDSEKNTRAVFTLARKLAPCVIYLDEVDSILSSRDQGDDTRYNTITSVKTTFMQEWDGLRTGQDRVLVVASTNRPYALDQAVLRRLPRRIMVDLPDLETREEILRVSLRNNRVDESINLREISKKLDGYSGSDIKEVCREAVLRVSNEKAKYMFEVEGLSSNELATNELRPVTNADFEASLEKLKASVSLSGRELEKVREWNNQYGEMKKAPKTQLSMYL